jgi:hypothetical protein
MGQNKTANSCTCNKTEIVILIKENHGITECMLKSSEETQN